MSSDQLKTFALSCYEILKISYLTDFSTDLLHGFTKSYLCSPFLSPLPGRWQFVAAPLHGFMEELVTAVIAEVFFMISFSLKRSVNV